MYQVELLPLPGLVEWPNVIGVVRGPVTQIPLCQKNDDSVWSPWESFKHTNIHFMGVPEGGEREEQEIEDLFEKMTENFLNLVKEIDVQVQEEQSVPNNRNTKRHTPKHIIIKMPKVKYEERIVKTAREK